MVFANKKLIEAAGAQVPTGDTMTWDELQSIAKATTKGGQYGRRLGAQEPNCDLHEPGARTSGGTFFEGTGEDAKITVGDAELALPALVKR